MTAFATVRSPLGPIAVEATERGVCGVTLGPRSVATGRPPITAAQREHLESGCEALRAYFAGRPPPLPALDLDGSAFDLRVWSALVRIPWGETVTYAELAASLGAPGAARAVGGANGRNPVAILVPCHRVVAASGLGGYAGGLDVKRWLLAHETAHAPALRPPVAGAAARRAR